MTNWLLLLIRIKMIMIDDYFILYYLGRRKGEMINLIVGDLHHYSDIEFNVLICYYNKKKKKQHYYDAAVLPLLLGIIISTTYYYL
mmetsp:Transcript_9793/g.16337  ORF Transcript_9793/g.16337 Transcript_9793/m.16337 type:complete len:86 (-) Transcript_9793:116-373(-)